MYIFISSIPLWNVAYLIGKCLYRSSLFVSFFKMKEKYSGSGKIGILNKVVLCSMILLYCITIKLYLEQVKINVRITKNDCSYVFQLLIGYENGTVVFWDLKSKRAELRVYYDEVSYFY